MTDFSPGDFVACYLTNTSVYEELLSWGMVIEVSRCLKDILVLDNLGNTNWYPSKRWRPLTDDQREKDILAGIILA